MPLARRRPLLKAVAAGGAAFMAAKAASKHREAQEPPDESPPQGVAASGSAPDRIAQLKQLADLKASGALTDEEFQREKQRILS
jgi:hypothetical protein